MTSAKPAAKLVAMRALAAILLLSLWAPLCPAQAPKAAPKQNRFQILSVQPKTVEEALGVPRTGDTVPYKLITARVAVNDKADAKGFAPTPPKILCYLYDDKKDYLAVIPGIVFKTNAQGKLDTGAPAFRSKVPTDVHFPYETKTKWKYAIIVLGDASEVAVHGYPSTVKNYDEFAFAEKKLLPSNSKAKEKP